MFIQKHTSFIPHVYFFRHVTVEHCDSVFHYTDVCFCSHINALAIQTTYLTNWHPLLVLWTCSLVKAQRVPFVRFLCSYAVRLAGIANQILRRIESYILVLLLILVLWQVEYSMRIVTNQFRTDWRSRERFSSSFFCKQPKSLLPDAQYQVS
jgi:hypothetical protein